jgi:hypothetical protein
VTIKGPSRGFGPALTLSRTRRWLSDLSTVDRGLGIFHRFDGGGGRNSVIEGVLPTVARLDSLAVETRNPRSPASRLSRRRR